MTRLGMPRLIGSLPFGGLSTEGYLAILGAVAVVNAISAGGDAVDLEIVAAWITDPDDPDSALAEAIMRSPGEAGPALAYAQAAQNREDWQRACDLWRYVRTRFPDEVTGYTEGLTCLMKTGPGTAIEELCAAGSERFPDIDRFGL